MPKLNVLLVCDLLIRDYDGCNRTLFHILDRYDKNKVKISIISGKVEGLQSGLKTLKLPNFTIPFNNDYSIAIPYLVSSQIQQFIDEINPDVIHITSPSPLGNHVLSLAQKRKIPVSTIYHTDFIGYVSYYVSHYNPLKDVIKQFLSSVAKKFYNGCDIVFAPTQFAKNYLVDIGIESSKIQIWERGIETSIFSKKIDRRIQIRNLLNIKKPIIFFASRLVWEKNLETLIGIYNFSINAGNKYQFVLAGDGVASLELKVKMPQALFLGNLEQQELSDWYNAADVFVFPSITETFGNVIIEAMSCGLPVIAANGGGSVSLIKHEQNGILVSPLKVEEYYFYIEKMIHDQIFKDRLIENGLAFTSSLSWPTLIQNFFQSLEILSFSKYIKKYAS